MFNSFVKKKIIYFVLLFLAVFFVFEHFQITRSEYSTKMVEYIKKKTQTDVSNKKGLPPNQYLERQYLLEMNPSTGKTSPENIEKIKQVQKSEFKIYKVPGESNELAWEERGPDNIGGRTRVLFYDPNDETGRRVFAGGVSGGLWVNNNITDENSLWFQVGIDENLSVSCFAIDPNDSNIWYIGTGESYTANDGTGNGLWKSINGGVNWTHEASVDLGRSEDGRLYFINQILARNNNGTTELFLAIDGAFDYDFVGYGLSGWWKQNEQSFERITFNTPNNSPYVFSDIEIALDNSIWVATKHNVFGHGGGKIFRSTDGVSFEEKYSFNNGGRVEISLSKQNSNVIYAVSEINSGVQLVKTINGEVFNEISKPNDVDEDISANDFARGQAFYNLMLEVDPLNDNILYAGGIDLFKSSDGGANWNQISKWSNSNNLRNLNVSFVHADQHALAFNSRDSNQAVFGNDGGVYYSNSLSNIDSNSRTISSRNKNYNVTQFYSAAIGQNINNDTFLGGAQDNGSLFVTNARDGINSYGDLFGGDGAQVFIDKDGDYAIVSFTNNTYSLQPLPFVSFNNQIEIEDDQETGQFINIADLDDHLDILYTDGSMGVGTNNLTERISRYTNLETFPIRTNFTNSLLRDVPTAIKVSPFTNNSSTVFIGTETGTMLKVTNFETDNPLWTSIDILESINVGAISDISFGDNENEIIITLHNYGVNNIYYTEDGGITWVEKDGDLPDIPTKSVLMNPLNEKEVIVGTNFGVWKTANFTESTPNWTQSQNGMSSVKVTQFDLRKEDNTVLASTYGRGFFTGQFKNDSLSLLPIDSELKQDEIEIKSFLENKTVEIEELIDLDQFVTVTVFGINGALLLKQELDFVTKSKHVLELPFQSGIYIVNVSYENQRVSKRIVLID